MARRRTIAFSSPSRSVTRRLCVISGIFVSIVLCLIVLSTLEMAVLSAVRSYVRGEGLWSKAQKQAVIRLRRYAESGHAGDLAAASGALAVPLGDRRARRALDAAELDLDAVRDGFLGGRNHPDDIPGMIRLYRHFGDARYMAEAITIWANADRHIERLARVGTQLEAEFARPLPRRARIAQLVRKIDDVEAKVTPLEDAFSATLGEGARWLHRVSVRVTWAAGGLLASLGLVAAWMLLRHARAWEERYRRLVETATDAIVVSDAGTGTVVDVNAKALDLIGRPGDDVIGMPAIALHPDGEARIHRDLVARATGATGTATGEIHLRNRDGGLVPVEASAGVTVVGGRRFVQVLFRDIRQRRRTEAALAASRRRLESEARIARAQSRAGHELMGSLDATAVVDRLARLAMRELRADGTAIFLRDAGTDDFARQATAGPLPASGGDVLAPRTVSALRDAGATAVILPTGAGSRDGRLALALRRGDELLGVLLATRQADGERFSDEDLRIARGLAHLGSMALANGLLVTELERASRLKSEFVSTMSHELRTPLNVVLGYAEMARETGEESERADFLRRVEDAGRDLLELIESTLEVGRADAGRDEVRCEPVHLPDLWASIGRGCGLMPRRPGVALDWHEPVPDVVVDTDPRKLVVIVRNLVSNALKFTERGSVGVTLAVEPDWFVVTVADTGIGIAPADQAVVFEMFRQADASDSRRFGGTGLGLYLARRFAEQLGGSIALESAPGVGSTFTVRLPATARGARASDVA